MSDDHVGQNGLCPPPTLYDNKDDARSSNSSYNYGNPGEGHGPQSTPYWSSAPPGPSGPTQHTSPSPPVHREHSFGAHTFDYVHREAGEDYGEQTIQEKIMKQEKILEQGKNMERCGAGEDYHRAPIDYSLPHTAPYPVNTRIPYPCKRECDQNNNTLLVGPPSMEGESKNRRTPSGESEVGPHHGRTNIPPQGRNGGGRMDVVDGCTDPVREQQSRSRSRPLCGGGDPDYYPSRGDERYATPPPLSPPQSTKRARVKEEMDMDDKNKTPVKVPKRGGEMHMLSTSICGQSHAVHRAHSMDYLPGDTSAFTHELIRAGVKEEVDRDKEVDAAHNDYGGTDPLDLPLSEYY